MSLKMATPNLSAIENLSPSKRRLLELMRARQANEGKTYPLSYPQQRLWFIEQVHPGTSAYNSSFALRLSGQLDKRALQESFHQIVRRHEVLRTTFPTLQDGPIQRVAPALEISIQEVDIGDSSAAEFG